MSDNTLTQKIWVVRFALGAAVVRLLSFYDYTDGRVYHVQDIITGNQDYVGEEYLEKI